IHPERVRNLQLHARLSFLASNFRLCWIRHSAREAAIRSRTSNTTIDWAVRARTPRDSCSCAPLHWRIRGMSTQTLEGQVSFTYATSDKQATSEDSQDVVIKAWKLLTSKQYAQAWDLLRPLVAARVPNPDLGMIYARLAQHIEQEPQALEYLEWLL